MQDISILKRTLEEIEKGTELALITITNSSGSTPRNKGTQMAVLKDGSIIGTIGGGSLEKRVIELAKEAIAKGESESVNLPLDTQGVEMICGGEVDIFIKVYSANPQLIIIGGGHVAYAIYKMALLLNFNITIFEDRIEFLNEQRFPDATELIHGDIAQNLSKYNITENSYIVIATRGHSCDQEALEAVVNSKAKYIGTMGSKRKILTIFDNLKEKGISNEALSKVYAPIGLDIGDNSPEEIAISILAEIIAVKNNKTSEHMKITLNITW